MFSDEKDRAEGNLGTVPCWLCNEDIPYTIAYVKVGLDGNLTFQCHKCSIAEIRIGERIMEAKTWCHRCKKPIDSNQSPRIVSRDTNTSWYYCDDCMRVEAEINTAVTQAKSNTIEGKLDEIIKLLTRISNRPPS